LKSLTFFNVYFGFNGDFMVRT